MTLKEELASAKEALAALKERIENNDAEAIAEGEKLQADICSMKPLDGTGCLVLGNGQKGYLVYAQESSVSLPVESGKYNIHTINTHTGEVKVLKKSIKINNTYDFTEVQKNTVLWLERL